MENSNLNFVKPAWIYAINERQKMLPYQPYTVVPWTFSLYMQPFMLLKKSTKFVTTKSQMCPRLLGLQSQKHWVGSQSLHWLYTVIYEMSRTNVLLQFGVKMLLKLNLL